MIKAGGRTGKGLFQLSGDLLFGLSRGEVAAFYACKDRADTAKK